MVTEPHSNFRVVRVDFDISENVSALTAVAVGACRRFVQEFVPDAALTDPHTVALTVTQVVELHNAASSIRRFDPRFDASHLIYNSLSVIVYGLMSDE